MHAMWAQNVFKGRMKTWIQLNRFTESREKITSLKSQTKGIPPQRENLCKNE